MTIKNFIKIKTKQFEKRREHCALCLELDASIYDDYTRKSTLWLEESMEQFAKEIIEEEIAIVEKMRDFYRLKKPSAVNIPKSKSLSGIYEDLVDPTIGAYDNTINELKSFLLK